MKLDSRQFQARSGKKINLRRQPTRIDPFYESKEHAQQLLTAQVAQLAKQQQLLWASDRYALLVIFQALDAAGKDGAIRHVMSGINPQGCQVHSFKHPSATELEHEIRRLGGEPAAGGTVAGALHRGWVSVKSALSIQDDKAVLQERYRELATERVERRIALTVLRLAAQIGERAAGNETMVELLLARQDLAEASGTTIFTVSRVLADWERRGLVETGRERVLIRNPHGLVQVAEGLDQ